MEIKNLEGYKFIIATGCSYGLLPVSVFRTFNLINRTHSFLDINRKLYDEYGKDWLDIDNNLIVINVSCSGQGSDWQSDSIIHVINKLIKIGVNTSDIYCLVEWSEWSRFTISQLYSTKINKDSFTWSEQNPFEIYDIHKTDILGHYDKLSSEIFEILKMNLSIPFRNVGRINDRFYLVPSIVNSDDFYRISKELGDFVKHVQKINQDYPTEKKIKDYLNNIIKTQFYLKSLGINYNFCFMQSSLSNWFKDDKKDKISHHLEPPYISNTSSFKDYKKNKNFNPINNINSDIENVVSEIKNEIDLLDMSNIWFYENEKFRRGGIDEWTIDNFKEVGYIKLFNNKENILSPIDMICDYGAHPNTVPYLTLWNKITTNCEYVKVKEDFENFMLNRYWEDYNFDGFSKNHITLSKKKWIEILNQ